MPFKFEMVTVITSFNPAL